MLSLIQNLGKFLLFVLPTTLEVSFLHVNDLFLFKIRFIQDIKLPTDLCNFFLNEKFRDSFIYQTFVYFHLVFSFLRVQPGLSYQFMVTINVEGTITAVASCSNMRSNQRKPRKPSGGSSPTHESDPKNDRRFSVREDI